MKKPNILFLMSDEHRSDVTGFEGNKIIRTPFLDKLAEEGVIFSNAYTPSPICIPARQCLMSGKLPVNCNCLDYGQDLTPGYMTFARRLSQIGYNTVACGKLHHMGSDQMQGWTRRIGSESHVNSHFIDGYELDNKNDGKFVTSKKWSDVKEIKRSGIGYGPAQKMDDYTIRGALDFIEDYFINPYYDRDNGEQPLLLKVSLLQPHYPYLTNKENFDYYLNRVPDYNEDKLTGHPKLDLRPVVVGEEVSEREVRRTTAAYYGMVDTIDQQYAKVVEALENANQNLDDWIVVYISDHGEMLGQHSVWEKQSYYEASVRIPLIIKWPASFEGGRTVKKNVSLCDLFATFCDILDISMPNDLNSRSLYPLLKDENADWDNEAVSELRDTIMIKRDDLKYQYYGKDFSEVLFDLKKDPTECIDYIDDENYKEAVEAFRKRVKELQQNKF